MIFDSTDENFESNKERNLYYKFLAGYFFNELVEEASERMQWFLQLIAKGGHLRDTEIKKSAKFDVSSDQKIHVSFDNHGIQHLGGGEAEDRGEFADILVAGRPNAWLIGIEAKFFSDWNFGKDIESNQERLLAMSKHWKICDGMTAHVLLVRRSKWENGVSKQNQAGSNVKQLVDALKSEGTRLVPIILHWEDFVDGAATGGFGGPAIEYLAERLKYADEAAS